MKIYPFGSKKALSIPIIYAINHSFNSGNFTHVIELYLESKVFFNTVLKHSNKIIMLKTKNNIVAYDPENLNDIIRSMRPRFNFIKNGWVYPEPETFMSQLANITNNRERTSKDNRLDFSPIDPVRCIAINNLKLDHPELNLYELTLGIF
jgi:hypothetical protein